MHPDTQDRIAVIEELFLLPSTGERLKFASQPVVQLCMNELAREIARLNSGDLSPKGRLSKR
jgi:hypothetical protein